MSFFEKVKAALSGFMSGRHGADQLGLFCLWAGLIINILDTFLGTGILAALGMALYILTVFRMFSRNTYQRAQENAKFMTYWDKVKKFFLRYFTRLKNCREYKYFSCPQCKASIRMKRGLGEKNITCPGCHHEFKQKS